MTTITKERAELKAFIAGFLSDPAHDNQSSRSMTAEVFRIALASLDAKPIYQYQSGIYNDDNGETDWYWDDCDAGFYKQYAADRRRIVYTAAPAPVVPVEMNSDKAWGELKISAEDCQAWSEGWNACRAAMLQGVEQPQNARQNIPENIPDGNSPAIPDDWVMVPKEPTQAMIKAWLSEVANFRGHAAGYKDALAAAPQQEVK
ncbi:hypothetical protein CSM33_001989 [Salmonella enterica subsp. diarizonae]|nr:hypothetical protein [Salmonella enterica]ECF6079386.1 hypothetical protein [Salmonella enterica subsp. diarizonae]EDQ4425732.1 hypothetical protein [Salmonella enterica subsp. salamae]EAV1166366.1 hypothetical protein [Salmonella enterica]EBI9866518.1 hypothetical protein [Salmonella enterica]